MVYWGSSASTKLAGSSPLAVIAKTGNNLSISLQPDTTIPQGATHFLVRTKNHSGEMASGVNVLIDDAGVPVQAAAAVAFTDTDPADGKIGGTVNITKASAESDITHYVLYWGFNDSTKLDGQPKIAELAKTGANLSFSFAAQTAIPVGATHLLVRTKNADGEMPTGPSTALTDL